MVLSTQTRFPSLKHQKCYKTNVKHLKATALFSMMYYLYTVKVITTDVMAKFQYCHYFAKWHGAHLHCTKLVLYGPVLWLTHQVGKMWLPCTLGVASVLFRAWKWQPVAINYTCRLMNPLLTKLVWGRWLDAVPNWVFCFKWMSCT